MNIPKSSLHSIIIYKHIITYWNLSALQLYEGSCVSLMRHDERYHIETCLHFHHWVFVKLRRKCNLLICLILLLSRKLNKLFLQLFYLTLILLYDYFSINRIRVIKVSHLFQQFVYRWWVIVDKQITKH